MGKPLLRCPSRARCCHLDSRPGGREAASPTKPKDSRATALPETRLPRQPDDPLASNGQVRDRRRPPSPGRPGQCSDRPGNAAKGRPSGATRLCTLPARRKPVLVEKLLMALWRGGSAPARSVLRPSNQTPQPNSPDEQLGALPPTPHVVPPGIVVNASHDPSQTGHQQEVSQTVHKWHRPKAGKAG